MATSTRAGGAKFQSRAMAMGDGRDVGVGEVWVREGVGEPEKETMSEMGLSVDDLAEGQERKTQPIDIPAAKLRKKVRFVLPVRE